MKKFIKIEIILIFSIFLMGFSQDDWKDIFQSYSDIINKNGALCSYSVRGDSGSLGFSKYQIYTVYNNGNLPNGIYDKYDNNSLMALITDDSNYTNSMGSVNINNKTIMYSNFNIKSFLNTYKSKNKCPTFVYFCPPVTDENGKNNSYEIIQSEVDNTYGHTCYQFVSSDATLEEIKPNGCNYEDAKECKIYNKSIVDKTVYIELGKTNNNGNYIMFSYSSDFASRGISVDSGYGTITATLSGGDAITIMKDDNGKSFFDYYCSNEKCSYPLDINLVYGCANYSYHYFIFANNSTYNNVEYGDITELTTDKCVRPSGQYVEEFGNADDVSYNDVEGMNFCSEDGVKMTLNIIGYVVFSLKMIVPLLLIIMGSLDFSKALISSDDKAIKDALGKLIRRIIAGIIVFFIPTILNYAFSLINEVSNNQANFTECSSCLFTPFNGCSYKKLGE